MRKTGYVKSAAILTGTGLVLRAAGMVLRVYVAGQLGAGGMGVYPVSYTHLDVYKRQGFCFA